MKSERQDSLLNLPSWNVCGDSAAAATVMATEYDWQLAEDHTETAAMSNCMARLSLNEHQPNNTDLSLRENDFNFNSEEEELDFHNLCLADEDGDTQLHISIIQEDEVTALGMIKRAPDFVFLNIPNNLGQTPMHIAALMNNSNIVRKLVCAGGDITHQDMTGNTPLHLACSRGYLGVVRELLRHVRYEETLDNSYPMPFVAIPQNMNMKNFDGLTCLHLAVLARHVDIVRLLLVAGADVNLGDSKSGRAALHMAAEQGMLDVALMLLLHRNTEVDTENYAGYTPVQLAHSRGHTVVTDWLCRHGASLSVLDCDCDNAENSNDNDDDEVQ